jgi:quinolinate synthase
MGVVAHYYMDVELQGVLTAVQRSAPEFQNRIGIADSLKMGDMAVAMCENANVQAVACLGVDFMSESVSAILHRNHFGHVPVYRATSAPIGCSLAESAERDSYRAWLEKEMRNEQALHVVYINTSLETKAVSSSIVPTITCTSSNVLQTMLQASAQVGPDLKILYGPDTYMGENLQTLLDSILNNNNDDNNNNGYWTDERIRQELHPAHNRQTLQQLRNKLTVFPSGNCIVHHMFGKSIVQTVRDHYSDCYVTAHLEVPGEMFSIAMEKSMSNHDNNNAGGGGGVVGSTSDILRFIASHATRAAATPGSTERLRFILGTEAGMVTSIVKSVQDILEQTKSQVEVEIIFPVASQAIMGVEGNDDLAIVPGVGGGEGCSTAGGCATCPFMKMNDLDALQNIIDMVESGDKEITLKAHLPPDRLRGKSINGVKAMDLGVESIMYMRDFMIQKKLPAELIDKVRAGAYTSS